MTLQRCVWVAGSGNSRWLVDIRGRAWMCIRGCHGVHGYRGLLKTQARGNANATG